MNSVLFTILLAPLSLGTGGHLGCWNLLMSGRYCLQIPFSKLLACNFFFFFTLIFSVTFIYLFCFYYFWEGMGFLFLSSYEGLVCHCIAMLFYMLLVGGIGGRESGYWSCIISQDNLTSRCNFLSYPVEED